VEPALRGAGLGLIPGKRSATLPRIEGLLGTVATPVPAGGEARRLGELKELADSCEAWAKVHGQEPHRAAVAAYVAQQGVAARAEAVRLATVSPNVAPTGYDPTRNRILNKANVLDMPSALAKLGTLIDLAVPAPGSRGEVEFEVDIPIPKTPAFLGFRFKAQGERSDPEKLKSRLELAFTGGVHIPGGMGRAAGELGGFSEAQGRNSEEVMRLFSYGLYRRARESLVSNAELTSLLWGGTTGQQGWERSEQWAGAVEKNILGESSDAYVQSGGFARGVAELELEPIGKDKFEAQLGAGKHWDAAGINAIADAKSEWSDQKQKDIVTELLKARPTGRAQRAVAQSLAGKGHIVPSAVLADIVESAPTWDEAGIRQAMIPHLRPGQKRTGLNSPEARPGFGQTLASKGENLIYFKTGAQVTAGLIRGEAKVEGAWISRARDTTIPSHFREGKVELKAAFYLNAAKMIHGDLFEVFQFEKLASALAELIKTLPIKSAKMDKTQKAGMATQVGTELTESVLQFKSIPQKEFNSAFHVSSPLSPGESVASLIQLVVETKVKARRKDSDPLPYEINISIGEEQSLRAEFVVARAKAKSFNRWFRANYKNGATWRFDALGRQVG
jgi:hypothetical protein